MKCFLCHEPLAIDADGMADTTFCQRCLDAQINHPEILERAVLDALDAAKGEK